MTSSSLREARSACTIRLMCKVFALSGSLTFRIYATETAAEINAHGVDYGLTFPGLLDPGLRLPRVAGAISASEAAVFAQDGELLYRDRIGNRTVKPGTMRPCASRHNLRLAIEAVLTGQKPEPRFTTSVGCYLPSK